MSEETKIEYEELYKTESYVYDGKFNLGVQINISAPTPLQNFEKVGREAAEIIKQAIVQDFYANDKDSQERASLEKFELINCFPNVPIYYKSIPNGYCSQACCLHKSWFEVTTRYGIITIGWRKRVIVIDWSKSDVTKTADELFPDEDVTKFDCLIHAWGYEKAREYLAKLLSIKL